MTKITENNLQDIISETEFSNITFSWIDFSNYKFDTKKIHDCIFEKCNLSNISVKNTCFNNVEFIKTKILWVDFCVVKDLLLYFNFKDCMITLCSFNEMNLKNIWFWASDIFESNFTWTNLTWADLSFSDLDKSIFLSSNLTKTIFTWAMNYSINPLNNTLEKTKFSRDNVFWLLDSFDIIVE